MQTAKIRVQSSQAANIARGALDRAVSSDRLPVVVSDQCVVRELLAQAAARGVKIEFYAVKDLGGKERLDRVGVQRVLAGREK